MTYTAAKAKEMISEIPRTQLGFFPTPLHKLEVLSEELGVNLWIKRDDFTGSNLFGGNKTRKLEFLIGHAKEIGAENVITYGATQSNHVMQTVWAAAKNGIKPIAYLAAMVTPDMDDLKGNMLLDKIYGADLHIVYPEEGESFTEAEERSFVMGREQVEKLNAAGHKCYDIPMGGANEYGSLGYINAVVELSEQLAQNQEKGIEFNPQYIYHATGSSGTMAGLVAGKKLLGMDVEIHSIMTIPMEDTSPYISGAKKLANDALGLIGVESLAETGDFIVDTSHAGDAYEMPTEEGSAAIKLLARKEGILVDPVYSGKAFAGLLADIREGRIAKGSDVLFLHTGGTTVFFAEKEILGDIF